MFIRLVYISFFGCLPRVVMLRKGAGCYFAVSGREEIRSHPCAFAVVCLVGRFWTYPLVVEGRLSRLQDLPDIWWPPPTGLLLVGGICV